MPAVSSGEADEADEADKEEAPAPARRGRKSVMPAVSETAEEESSGAGKKRKSMEVVEGKAAEEEAAPAPAKRSRKS
eukprot:1695240-Rhodomonas_salina.1